MSIMNRRGLLTQAGGTAFGLAAPGALAQTSITFPNNQKLQEILDKIARTQFGFGEPRIPVTSLSGSGQAMYVINLPGSYYLTENLVGDSRHGIEITSSNVTLDLMGYALIGASGSGDGIRITTPPSGDITNISIHNGSVIGWSNGIYNDIAHPQYHANNCLLSDLRFSYNRVAGLQASHRTVLMNCVAEWNGSNGLNFGSDSVMVNCVASHNGSTGVATGRFSTVIGCTMTFNGVQGLYVDGMNTVVNCTASGNNSHGIESALCCGGGSRSSTTILGCLCTGNLGSGIRALGRCLIRDNSCIGNSAAGIRVEDQGSRVDQNHAADSPIGVHVNSAGSHLIISNSFFGNSVDIDDPSGNAVGPILNKGDLAVSCNPHANYRLD